MLPTPPRYTRTDTRFPSTTLFRSLHTFGSPGLAKVFIRGINSVSFNATTGTYIDDIPFGSSTLFAGGALLTPDLDPSILERVEVLKGPQGTLYGASAPGGEIGRAHV